MAKKANQASKKKVETTRCPSCGDPAQLIGEYSILWRDPVRRHYQFDKDRRRMRAWACSNHKFCTMVTLEGEPCIPIVSQSETEPVTKEECRDEARTSPVDCDMPVSQRVSKIVSKILEPVS